MKKITLWGATFAILGLAVAPMLAQTQSTTSSSTSYIESSKIIGTTVKSSQGEEIGTIKDVILDRNTGCMAYTVLSTGGTTSRVKGSSKTVAVPWTVYTTSSDPRVMTVRVEKEKIYNAPVFEYSRVQEYSTSGWINNVNTYYGVTPGVSAGVGVSYQSTTNTGAAAATSTSSGQTNATASPAVSASPVASASAATTASPAVSATPAVSASPSASASPTASAARSKAGTSPKPKLTPVSPRHRGNEMMSPGTKKTEEASPSESKSESTTSESPSKKSTHHRASQSVSPAPSASPQE